MQQDPQAPATETDAGLPAARSTDLAPSAPAEPFRLPDGGAGLRETRGGSRAGLFAGLGALALTLALGGTLVAANPAFRDGKAGGTADRLGQTAAERQAAASKEVTGIALEGKKLVGGKGCGNCHVIPGLSAAKGTVGPSLAGVGSKTSIAGGAVKIAGPDDLKKWILDPPGLKPGTAMPNLGLTDDEATKIVAYLETLK